MATEYGLRLRAARKRAKMTQIEASKASGIPQSTISTSERESHGSSETPVYAKLYGVDAHWLATGEGEMLPVSSKVEASNVTALPAPALRSLDDVLAELQTVVDGLSPLLQDAGRAVLIKWINGQASRGDAVATLEGLRQASATPVAGGGSGTEKQRAA